MLATTTASKPLSTGKYSLLVIVANRLSFETPDVVNAFGVLAKEDTSHGFPVWRPLERNSDWSLYNINSEGWF